MKRIPGTFIDQSIGCEYIALSEAPRRIGRRALTLYDAIEDSRIPFVVVPSCTSINADDLRKIKGGSE